jgi:transposase
LARKLMSDVEWAFFEPFIMGIRQPNGRKPVDHRRVLDGVFWIARTCSPFDATVVIERAVTFRRRGVETRIVIPGREKTLAPDAKLIALITQGHRWP